MPHARKFSPSLNITVGIAELYGEFLTIAATNMPHLNAIAIIDYFFQDPLMDVNICKEFLHFQIGSVEYQKRRSGVIVGY